MSLCESAPRLGTVLLTCLLLFSSGLTNAQVRSKQQTSGTDLIGRGKYIVEQVALCVECHTPRDENGSLKVSEYLKGAPIPVKSPPYPQMKWALKAPAIAGLPGYTEQESIRLLTDGLTRDGRRPDPPMPHFRLNRADAEAVVAYLKSLR
jgi:mono/diheme cytochrome c family protein